MTTLISTDTAVHDTTCPYCGVGCGVKAEVVNGELVNVSGDKAHPANYGRLCVKGSALHETVSQSNRLLAPQVNGKDTDWHTALDYVAERWQKIIDEHGPDSVAFYLSGQLLTEDYYVANKLMKGFVGTSNIDTNSRLCMASAVVAHKRAFGGDAVPASYEDLESTQALFLVGSNAAYAHPIIYQRLSKAKKDRDFSLVVLDPRRTATCDLADLHVPLSPGSDAFFFNGLLSYLAANNKIDQAYIDAHCDGFDETLAIAQSQVPDIETAAKYCDVDADVIRQAYEIFAQNNDVITMFSQGINQSSSGVDKGNSIINCHLATGKIGRVGAAPFSITGQPNAMGGREVGGLANQFAAHMGFTPDAIERVDKFWGASRIATSEGAKAVEMFDAVRSGKIKAIWIMATNPVVSMPAADKVKEALEACDLVVVSDCMANTDTAATADVLLPATGWSEKHGMVTNSERCISLQKGFIKPPGQAKNDWEIICDFAKHLGYGDAFNYSHPVEIFREHAKLSGLDNNGNRAFDISGLADISLADYESFTPMHWPVNAAFPKGTKRLFEDGQYYTANKRAKLIPITARPPMLLPAADELVMNTGRIRDQWHTMTRTGKASRLLSHSSEPYIEIHPSDAKKFSLREKELVELENLGSRFLGRVNITEAQRESEIFVPMHWNAVYSSFGRSDALVAPNIDPFSGQPEFKQCPVKARAYDARWHGILVSVDEIEPEADYWAKITADTGFCCTLADTETPENWARWLEAQYPHISDWVGMEDTEGQSARLAGFENGLLKVVLIVAASIDAVPSQQWLLGQLNQSLPLNERFTVLAGSSGDPSQDVGAIICSCYQIGENQINQAINDGCFTTEALGEKLKCGTNCGSCIPELSSMIDAEKAKSA